ncbi:hypothetical protein [Bacillus pseudomycoides]|nr:hypothetical protein [Bacillus pseudomycoides]
MAKIKESDLFEIVKEWLEEQEYEVFSEVSSKYAGNSYVSHKKRGI